MTKPPRQKPAKPPGCPLTPHANGQWCARIAGKYTYFGPWADLDGATRRYYETKAAIAGGKAVDGVVDSQAAGGTTIKDVCDVYLDAKKRAVDAKELRQRTFDEYLATCLNIADEFGRGRLVVTLGPVEFGKFRSKLAKRLGPVRLGNEIQRIRSVFKFAFDSELLDRPVRFGPEFKRPSVRAIRERRNEVGSRLVSPDLLRRLIEAASPPIKAMILLGINCGFGAADIGALPIEAVDFRDGWVNFPRPKTAMPRRAPLWPETLAALTWVRDNRRMPAERKHDSLLFITQQFGRPWMRYSTAGGKVDNVRHEFRKVVLNLNAKVHFYDLRRTFRTIADETGDQAACGLVMGHAVSSRDMAAVYRQQISDDRLRKVADHVRTWLWPKSPETTAKESQPD